MPDVNPLNIIALDTSSDYCSVSLYSNGTCHSLGELAPRKHAHHLMPMVQQLVSESGIALKQLDAVAFGCGPGSFTGLRIAAGVAQGLAYGLSCPVIPVSNLRTLALQAYEKFQTHRVLVAIDARMDEVYWSQNEISVDEVSGAVDVQNRSEEQVTKPELLELFCGNEDAGLGVDEQAHANAFVGVGSGFDFYERFPKAVLSRIAQFDASLKPHAEAVCKLALVDYQQGRHCRPQEAAPVYIRDEVAWKKLPGRE